ncbi:hypothetical protein HAP94_07325 [Acidithiobacillus ferrivorans]|nr:hypothetical protein [Acidithiobacillus ferrivorans]
MESCKGLSSADTQRRSVWYGPNKPNAAVEEKPKTWQLFLHKFWAPVPWMLEITPVLEALLGKWTEVVIITLLLIFYGMLGFSQERRVLLIWAIEVICSRPKERLRIHARVCRAATGSGRACVAADLVHVRVGDIVPADLQLSDGQILVDQSALSCRRKGYDGVVCGQYPSCGNQGDGGHHALQRWGLTGKVHGTH